MGSILAGWSDNAPAGSNGRGSRAGANDKAVVRP